MPLNKTQTQFFDYATLCINIVYKQNIAETWTKSFILLFTKKGDLGPTKSYRRNTLSAIAAKVYDALLLNRIQSEVEKILKRNRSPTSLILTICRIMKEVHEKNIEAILMFTQERYINYYQHMVS